MKKSNPSKKIVISGYYGFDNFGDEAILAVLIQKLKEFNTQIRVFSTNPEKTKKTYEVDATNSFSLQNVINDIIKSDILVSGGGSLLQDVTSLKSLIYYLIVINTALIFRKKVIIFAQGIGPIRNPFGAWLTKLTLKRCHYVSVRDERSYRLLRRWKVESNLLCDPLFALETTNPTHSNIVGVQLRNFKTLKDNLLDKLANQINEEFNDKLIQIFSFQDSLDLAVCKKFEAMLKEINPQIKTEIVHNMTSDEVLTNLSKLDYMIAMRFHANLIALKYGIKTLAICYDEKVEKLAIEAQIPYLSMNADEDYEQYFQQLKNLDESKIQSFSNSQYFDWKGVTELIQKDS